MCKLLGLTLGTIFLTTFLYGQEIIKEDIIKFKIKSITTIGREGKIKSIDFYNDRGHMVQIRDDDNGQARREFIYDGKGILIEEKTFSSAGEIHRFTLLTNTTITQTINSLKKNELTPIKASMQRGSMSIMKMPIK